MRLVVRFYLHHIAAKEILILLEGANVLSALTTLAIVKPITWLLGVQ